MVCVVAYIVLFGTSCIFMGMIRLLEIFKTALCEAMSFDQLFRVTSQMRLAKSKKMRVRSLAGTANEDNEYWNFAYKSDPIHITTGRGYTGRISFEKDAYKKYGKSNRSMNEIMCRVDCGCPDYRYRWAYANHAQDAGEMGGDSLNRCNGARPLKTNPRLKPSLCKHLASLRGYLLTKLKDRKGSLDERLSGIVKENPQFEIRVRD